MSLVNLRRRPRRTGADPGPLGKPSSARDQVIQVGILFALLRGAYLFGKQPTIPKAAK